MGFICVCGCFFPLAAPGDRPFVFISNPRSSIFRVPSFQRIRGKDGVIRLATGRGSSVASCFLDWDFWLLVSFGLFILFLRAVLSWGSYSASSLVSFCWISSLFVFLFILLLRYHLHSS